MAQQPPPTIYTPSFRLPSGGKSRLHTPQTPKDKAKSQISEAIVAVRHELECRRCEDSLYEFVKAAWHVVEPGVEFSEGWHIKVICEHLEAVSDRRIHNLIINIPPRHSKSTICTVIWPVWAWIKNPAEKFLTASYSGSLSIRDTVKSRRLLQSAWFKSRWPHITLNADQNTKQRYENDDTGYRIAASVGGTTTGEGGSILLIDDAHGAQDAQSDTMRNSTIEWLDMVWSSRKNDPKTSCSVVIMQRLHENDATGHLLEQGNYEHLCLPAEYDGIRRSTSLGEYDPRTEIGELLWPNRFGKPELDVLKKALGTFGASGQLQQNPSPPGGGILKVDHIQLWPCDMDLPHFQYIVLSMDTAFSEDATSRNDPTGCIAFGVFTHRKEQCLMVLDVWNEHLGYPDLKQRVMDEWKTLYGGVDGDSQKKGRRPDTFLIEQKASGQSLIQDLRRSNIPAISYNPGKADKVQRAHLAAPFLETDCLYMIESKKNPGQPVSWAKPAKDNWEKFPRVAHDEMTDALAQCVIYLKDNGWLDNPVVEDDESERYADDTAPRHNPYAQ